MTKKEELLFDYDKVRKNFELTIPTDFNFAFDIVGKRAKNNDKTALITLDQKSKNPIYHTYSELDKNSNKFANLLLDLECARNDFAFVMIPRKAAWYHVLLGCMKVGVVAMPGTNLLTAKDMEYRINRSGAKLAIVTEEHVEKVNSIRNNCPSLKHLITISGNTTDGWVCMEDSCRNASSHFERSKVAPNKSTDPMLIYFTSGTTSMPKMVERDHAYALAHTICLLYTSPSPRDQRGSRMPSWA